MKNLFFYIILIFFCNSCKSTKTINEFGETHRCDLVDFEEFLCLDFFSKKRPHINGYNHFVDSISFQTLRYLMQPSSLSMEYRLLNQLKIYPDSFKKENTGKSFGNRINIYIGIRGTYYYTVTEGGLAPSFTFRYMPKNDTLKQYKTSWWRKRYVDYIASDEIAALYSTINNRIILKQWFCTDTAFSPLKHIQHRGSSPFVSIWKVERRVDYPANKKQEDGLIYKYRYKIEKFPDSLTYPDTSVVYMAVSDNIYNKCAKYPERELELRFKEFSPDGIIDLNPETDKYEVSIRSLWYISIQDIIYGPLNSCYSPAYYENNLYQLKRKFKRYIRKSFRKGNLSYHKSFFKLALYKLYKPNKLILVSKKGENAVFQFSSKNPDYPGNYEVKFNIYEPYCFKVFKR